MARALPVLLALLLAAPAFAAPPDDARIVGGTTATRPYEHQAFLRINFASAQGRCGGSLIAAQYVLTAAHCLRFDNPNTGLTESPTQIRVNLNRADISGDPPPDFMGQIPGMVHPNYAGGPDGGYDVAIIRLNGSATVEQARLLRPADAALWQPGTVATVIGWGLTEDVSEGGAPSDQLREVQIPIFSDDGCSADFAAVGAPPDFFRRDTMVCAGGKDGKDSCQGDSGGPLLVPAGPSLPLGIGGIVSFGAVFRDASGNAFSCAEDVPGIYSRIGSDPLNSWVRSVVPLVEIDLSPPEPEPGQDVTMRAVGSGYSSFEWDLDADGSFDDATGPSATRRFDPGVAAVGVRAGGSEVRRIPIHARFRSPVAFEVAAVTVKEGEPIALTVTKQSRGAGSVTAQPSAGTAQPGADVSPSPVTLTFAADQATMPVSIPTIEDREVEGPETMRVDLTSHTGELLPGSPGQVLVTILDDDKPPRVTGLPKSLRARSGKVKVRYTISVPGRISIRLQDRRSGTSLGSVRRTHGSAGTFTDAVKLSKSAVKRLRRTRRLRARVVVAILENSDVLASKRGNVTLRR